VGRGGVITNLVPAPQRVIQRVIPIPITGVEMEKLEDIKTKVCPGCGKTLKREDYIMSKWVKKVCCNVECFRAYQKKNPNHPWRAVNPNTAAKVAARKSIKKGGGKNE
jgi:hypothetical protein